LALVQIKNDSAIYKTDFLYHDIEFGGDSLLIIDIWMKKGYMDFSGNVVIPMQYSSITKFIKGKAKVSFNYAGTDAFYINRKGERIE
jgi:hypothetical protein